MQLVNLQGKRFGRLIVLHRIDPPNHVKKNSVYWLCRCDCGKKKAIKGDNLKNGSTTSCGCWRKEKFLKHGLAVANDGKPDMVYSLWKGAQTRARKKGVPFEIGMEDIEVPEYCPALGIKLEQTDGLPGDCSPSLDRIIPELGYVPGNIMVISRRANVIKQNADWVEIRMVSDWLKSVVDGAS